MDSTDSMINPEDCLPAELRGPTTTIRRIASGLSGAGVYRVEVDGRVFVLKLSGSEDSLAAFRHKLNIQQLAANAGLAARIVHTDETRRALVSAFVVDRSFAAFYGDPRTRDTALEQLAHTLRQVHALPHPPDAQLKDPRAFLAKLWPQVSEGFALPGFVRDAVERVLTEQAPALERDLVLSHNDVNPTNLVYDGERLLLLDWETAGLNDPFYDLAAISVFLRMDDETCRRLLAIYERVPASALPARFAYNRQLVAVLCGTMFLHLARKSGHPGEGGAETLDSAPSLTEFYQRLRAGALSLASPEGRWEFGLALVKESVDRLE